MASEPNIYDLKLQRKALALQELRAYEATLDPVKLRLLKLVRTNAMLAYHQSLGCHSPAQRQAFDEITHPQVGDLVMEISTWYHPTAYADQGLGTLLAIEHIPAWVAEEGEKPEDIPTYPVYTLRLDFADGREFRWENCMFIKVLERLPDHSIG